MGEKTLFVGKERICKQVAYVLDIHDYALTEKLTKRNVAQYHDHQIYVCEVKQKSRKMVKLGGAGSQLNIQYLDDICRSIDEEYAANRERHKNDFKNFKESLNTKTTSPDKKTTTKSVVAETPVTTVQPNLDSESIKKEMSAEVHQPLWRRIMRGMKHPLRATWHVVLRTKEKIKQQETNARRNKSEYKRQKQICKQLYKRNSKNLGQYLRSLKPSELLLYVLHAKPNKNISCTRLESDIQLSREGNIFGCCFAAVPFGNLLYDGELDEIYHSTYARIVKLSSLSRSYCLCDINRVGIDYCLRKKALLNEQWITTIYPTFILLRFDQSCNLCCKSCRGKHYVMDDITRAQTAMTVDKLVKSGYLGRTKLLNATGMGEVFYSPYYRKLITSDIKCKYIIIKSNGTLFNESNWNLLKGKYETIDVSISIDAATAETYQQLRGASFENLMQNLNMLADLHRQKQINQFTICFVVQRDNFREMPAFVELGRKLGVDRINFQRLNNLGSFTKQELLERCLIIHNEYLDYELWRILQDPIFKDPIVDLQGLQRYIDASERRYRKRYEREQRKQPRAGKVAA